MATELAVRFPLGRYHATPWGHSANEGAVEWPPSPWRLCRALYAVWKERRPHLDERDVREVLEVLAAPPAYRVPVWDRAHTRHYVPGSERDLKTKVERRLLLLDAFVAVDRDERLRIRWERDLGEAARETLRDLLGGLAWLGRQESACETTLLDDGDGQSPNGDRRWALPPGQQGSDSDDGEGRELSRLLAPRLPLDIDALTASPTALRRQGHLVPPGSQWIDYLVPVARSGDSREPQGQAGPVTAGRREPAPTAAVLALDSPALPAVYATIVVADSVRSAAMSKAGSLFSGVPAPDELSGKDPDGTPLEGHRHAHYLPLDTTGDRLIDRVLVWAPKGLSTSAVAALSALRWVSPFAPTKQMGRCRVAAEAFGALEGVAKRLPSRVRLLGPSRDWETVTPFVPPHHRKRQSVEEFVDAQVRREWERRLRDAVAEGPQADLISVRVDRQRADAVQYRRRRLPPRDADRRARLVEQHARNRPGYHVTVQLSREVDGPLSLGAFNHFGLGLFRAVG